MLSCFVFENPYLSTCVSNKNVTYVHLILFYLSLQCAVLGGNLHLLRWLVDEHCCPLRSIRISNGKQKDSSGSYTPILTSKGRSLLGIALANRHIGILRYLVVEKRMLLSAEKGLSTETLVQNLDLVLRVLPEETLDEQGLDHTGKKITCHGADSSGRPSSTSTLGISESTRSSSPYEHDADYSSINQERSISDDGSDSDQVRVFYEYIYVLYMYMCICVFFFKGERTRIVLASQRC